MLMVLLLLVVFLNGIRAVFRDLILLHVYIYFAFAGCFELGQ